MKTKAAEIHREYGEDEEHEVDGGKGAEDSLILVLGKIINGSFLYCLEETLV